MPGRLSPAALPVRLRSTLAALVLGACLFSSSGCNSALVHGLATAWESSSDVPWSYWPAPSSAAGEDQALLARFAPAFVLEEGEAEYNRIGTPVLSSRAGIERARVDPLQPTLFGEVRAERVGTRDVLQLVYRIHFDQFALRAGTILSVHRNAGLLVLVTVDRETLVPLVVTTVHTCGCWLAVQPTAALAGAALPEDWPAERLEVAGESLDAHLAVPAESQRFVLGLRSRTHRVYAVRVEDPPCGADVLDLPLRELDELERLPIAGTRETGSFYYEGGYLHGYVKGAWAPLEGLTLGLLTLDPRLGMDRDFGDPAETGARFFTALAPWKREASRLDRFGRALEGLGFRLAAFAPGSPRRNPTPAESQPDASWQGAATTRIGGGILGGAATPPRRIRLSSKAAWDSFSGSSVD